MLACVLIGKGLEPGMRWILAGICPASTSYKSRAMGAFGHADLSSFQAAEGPRPSGELDVGTQARITRRLRETGTASPLPVLTPAQMLETLVRQAAGESFLAKLESIKASQLETRDVASDSAARSRHQSR